MQRGRVARLALAIGMAATTLTVAGTTSVSGGAPAGAGGLGTLYFSRDDVSELYVIDTTDGTALLVGTTGTNSATVGLTEGPDPEVLIGSTWQDLSRIRADGSGFTPAGTDELLAEGLAYDPVNGHLYRTLNGELTTAALTSGSFVPNELTGPPEDLEGLAWRDDGRLYGLGRDSSWLFAYDIVGGTWSTVGDTGIADNEAFGLAWDPGGDVLYSINATGDVHAIDPDTAEATLLGNTGLTGGGGLAFLPSPPPAATLVAQVPDGTPGTNVTFPVGGVCGEGPGNTVALSISGPGGVSAGPVQVITGDDGGYTAELLVREAPAGPYTVSGSCTVDGATVALPESTTVLGAVVGPSPPSQAPAAVPGAPRFTG